MALDLAEQLLAELTALPAVHRAAYAGSLRRMRETVGDINLLVTSEQPEAVMSAFCALPLVSRVLAHGPTKSSIVTTKGVQVDLRVVEPAVWGAALMYFTGSKPHNIRLRQIAVRGGLKLSEYGLFEVETGRQTRRGDRARRVRASRPALDRTDAARGPRRGRSSAAPATCPAWFRNTTSAVTCTHRPHRRGRPARGDDDRRSGAWLRVLRDHRSAPQLYMQRMTSEKMLAQRRELRALDRRSRWRCCTAPN